MLSASNINKRSLNTKKSEKKFGIVENIELRKTTVIIRMVKFDVDVNLIDIVEEKQIKMKQNVFEYSSTITRK